MPVGVGVESLSAESASSCEVQGTVGQSAAAC